MPMARSTLAKAFTQAFGRASPPAKPLRFADPVLQYNWEFIQKEISGGWYHDGFLYLLGERLDELLPCLDAWSFLLPRRKTPVIVGRNAYGALLVMPDSTTTAIDPTIGILDPTRVSWTSNPNIGFGNLLGAWLPEGLLPEFIDEAPYQAWRRAGGGKLAVNEMLAPKVAVALGGTMDVDNLEVRDMVAYYEATGPIYEKARKAKPAGRGGGRRRGKGGKR